MNETQQTTRTSSLMGVDPLFGPGTVAAWYLTLLTCVLPWMFDAAGRKRGTIEADLAVSLIFPVVAVANLLSQIVHLDPDDADTTYAIDAPLVIVKAFVPIAGYMCLLNLDSGINRRVLLVGVVGLLCNGGETYAYSSGFRHEDHSADVVRRVVLGPWGILSMLALLWGNATVLEFSWQVFRAMFSRLTTRYFSRPEAVHSLSGPYTWPWPLPCRYTLLCPYTSLWTCLLLLRSIQAFGIEDPESHMLLTIAWMSQHLCFTFSTVALMAVLENAIGRSAENGFRLLLEHLFPKSPASLTDLDQLAALLGGVVMLSVRVYDATGPYRKKWSKAKRRQRELREQENIRLGNIIAPRIDRDVERN
ncbi:hypothetical protein LTR84_000375 [Exophiala bonariae]|uniref:Uncharacterized protein n=1 Tax=Exophiala bonariae TaxID=1690606 RepID=A0AAV9NQR9_9EURO|nr:hypothetical protein LTR84_000375 [Exophiala bonariae]